MKDYHINIFYSDDDDGYIAGNGNLKMTHRGNLKMTHPGLG